MHTVILLLRGSCARRVDERQEAPRTERNRQCAGILGGANEQDSVTTRVALCRRSTTISEKAKQREEYTPRVNGRAAAICAAKTHGADASSRRRHDLVPPPPPFTTHKVMNTFSRRANDEVAYHGKAPYLPPPPKISATRKPISKRTLHERVKEWHPILKIQ